MDLDDESPGKFGLAFRFRAGEEDLEELTVSEPSPNSSQFEGLHKIFHELPKKLLNKDQSVSDSEDTSESSKLSEWWKDSEDNRNFRSGSSLSLPESVGSPKKQNVSLPDIKIAKGRVDKNQAPDDVEPAQEVDEDLTSAGTSTSQQSTPTNPEHLSSFPVPPPESNAVDQARLVAHFRKAFGSLIGWCIPIIAALLVTGNLFLNGVIFGVCAVSICKIIWVTCMDVWFPPSTEIQRGPAPLPEEVVLPPLQTLVQPVKKRGCFNVYNKPYDPGTYSVSFTRPVCLEIKGSVLRVTRVKSKLPKRAHFNESDFQLDTSKSAFYDLARCSVMLLPHGLTRKRLFSKKYPITVLLGEGAVIKNTKHGDESFHVGATDTSDLKSRLDAENENISRASLELESDAAPNTPALYFFARCDRDKEDWYRRLLKATDFVADSLNQHMHSFSSINESTEESVLSSMEDYLVVMSKFLDLPDGLLNKKALAAETELETGADNLDLQWLNVIVNRLLFDVCRSDYWTQKIQEKLQKKLSTLQLPYYVEEMQISELDLGRIGPVIHRVSKPTLDERGLWVDFDLTHPGTIKVTIQTKLNLHKLQKGKNCEDLDVSIEDKMKSRLYDSEAEDTAESSSDEELRSETPPPGNSEMDTPGKSKKKHVNFLRIVENVAQSRTFQRVANTKVGQNIIAGVSNTNLTLKLNVKGIQGTLAVNIPPPPSDRLWYGFRGMPKVWLTATPQFGTVTSSHVKNWIEKKLIHEFQYRFVLPQMGNILLPGGSAEVRHSEAYVSPSLFTDDDQHSLAILLKSELEPHDNADVEDVLKKDACGKSERTERYNKMSSRDSSFSDATLTAIPEHDESKRNSSGKESYDLENPSSKTLIGSIYDDEGRVSTESYKKKDSKDNILKTSEDDGERSTEETPFCRKNSYGKETYHVCPHDE